MPAQSDTERFHYLTSHLNRYAATSDAGDAVMHDWKLCITGQVRHLEQ